MTQPMYLQPNQAQYAPYPMQQPSVNAVKIDIINPQAMGSSMPQMPQVQQPQFYYNYPQAQQYPIPPIMAQLPQLPQMPAYPTYQIPQQAPAPAAIQPHVTPQMPVQQPFFQNNPLQPSPVAQAPIAQPQIDIPQPIVLPPAPSVIEAPIAAQPIPAPVAAPVTTVQPQAPMATQEIAPQPQAQPAVQQTVAPQVEQTPQAGQVDLMGLKTKLASANLEDQINAIQEIIHIGKNEPARADQLLDVDIINGLLDVMKKDNSSLPGPTPEQIAARDKAVEGTLLTPEEKALAESISPLETAEMNKTFAIFALAILQKHFMEKVDQDYKMQLEQIKKNDPNSTAQPDILPVELKDVPGLAQVVETAKQNPNPVIRENAIQALAYIARPQDKAILSDVFKIATTDANPIVKQAAEEALATVSKLPDAV